ncbi:hypothetical protein BDV98DRAFT_560526, partial [Pterulicium gracile]
MRHALRLQDWACVAQHSQKVERAARPIYQHGVASLWVATAWEIVGKLESLQVDWNTVDPLAYANRVEADL